MFRRVVLWSAAPLTSAASWLAGPLLPAVAARRRERFPRIKSILIILSCKKFSSVATVRCWRVSLCWPHSEHLIVCVCVCVCLCVCVRASASLKCRSRISVFSRLAPRTMARRTIFGIRCSTDLVDSRFSGFRRLANLERLTFPPERVTVHSRGGGSCSIHVLGKLNVFSKPYLRFPVSVKNATRRDAMGLLFLALPIRMPSDGTESKMDGKQHSKDGDRQTSKRASKRASERASERQRRFAEQTMQQRTHERRDASIDSIANLVCAGHLWIPHVERNVFSVRTAVQHSGVFDPSPGWLAGWLVGLKPDEHFLRRSIGWSVGRVSHQRLAGSCSSFPLS